MIGGNKYKKKTVGSNASARSHPPPPNDFRKAPTTQPMGIKAHVSTSSVSNDAQAESLLEFPAVCSSSFGYQSQ
eukprot:m.268924 g.268924  ORF g.268924 m.268924 type:complete len:74 (-) comp17660_c0_seq1:642-863(-)